MNAATIAFQLDSATFLALISQIGVVYGFISDVYVLKLPIQDMELVGALIVLTFNIIAIVC